MAGEGHCAFEDRVANCLDWVSALDMMAAGLRHPNEQATSAFDAVLGELREEVSALLSKAPDQIKGAWY